VILVKPVFFKICTSIIKPFVLLIHVIVLLLVPIFQILLVAKRKFVAISKPAKNRIMLIVANRYTVHTILISIVLIIGVLNLRTGVVRAESFGRDSIMYGLVSEEKVEIIQEFAGEDQHVSYTENHYREQTGLSENIITDSAVLAQREIDVSGLFEGGIEAQENNDQVISSRSQVEQYEVQSGDSLSAIAKKYDLSVNTLLWANNLSVSSVLRPGDSLDILPIDGVEHTVKSGDTIAQISRTYDVDQKTILSFNSMDDSDILSIGDQLIIPGGEKRAVARSTSTAISQLLTQPSKTAANVVSSGSGYMIWPTDLSVTTQYFGWSHNGLDIDCYYNNYNYAADAGYVTKAGWFGGYGYLVEIDHGNGIVTRYGHHAALYVVPGQYVNAGEALGLCGTTGTSSGTHLHLEVIVNGVRRNPLEYIR
jgi:murein DD-endopeptidase MepM/ murein hydrolase activator NlpD